MGTFIHFNESDEILDIRYDKVFKAVFTSSHPASRAALSDLVSALIGKKVSIFSILANEPAADDIHDRNIRFDIACKTEAGELVNIEMSLNPGFCEPVRLEYYASKLFTRQDIHGKEKNYSNLKETYQIAILAKRKYWEDEKVIHTFLYYDPVNNVPLNGKSRVITLELSKAEQLIEKPTGEMAAYEAWAVFFQYLTNIDKRAKINEILRYEEGIAMASEVLVTITEDDKEWARQLSKFKYELDLQSDRSEARAEGRKEGLEEGREEGRKEGLEEGRAENRLATARNLKTYGVSVDIIAGSTGLTPEEIAVL